MSKGLVFYGGWDGHEPKQVAEYFGQLLRKKQVDVTITDDMTKLEDTGFTGSMDIIVPVVTMAQISKEQVESVSEAVAGGTGLLGCHGGMCDAFRDSVLWQFMTGGNWVSHPGGDGVPYQVEIRNSSSPLVAEIDNFQVESEHYYLHVDPVVEVLATTRFPNVHWYHSTNGSVDMPVVWTKKWGHGRVYYISLGHKLNIVQMAPVTELIQRGMDYCLAGKQRALDLGLTKDQFTSDQKMF
jgi:type 1 glutamine amidotransferase